MGWTRYLVFGEIAFAVMASIVGAVGLIVVPGNSPIPVHAGFRGFDSFAPRTRGLVTLTLLPLLVGGALVLAYWSRADSPASRATAGVVGFAAMLILFVFNIQAIRYGMRFDS